ncbi:MAG: DUF1156 domain-containing protein [Gemmatimonadales bacterium]|nr:DUF1156 domain-containing protein [Gemmatimonadales bacterium]MYG50145.1 DUF1156 domain-containing protein [Gemmatimonadales bacterium]MYK01358.1 DUF1156 domain-containing protein [Candidatus Palauibacter ramosifaciens]
MIPKECKRLAEVDFPIAEVSRHAVREKSIRHGHPSTLHQWWARRPLASSRAVLLALLLPDPCDEHCPEEFKKRACGILREVRQPPRTDAELRKALLWFIGTFANWDLAAEATYVRVARNLVKAAHGDQAPLVVDPFAGGGSIPLEALRLGCEAFASDLNPVACLILKVLLEDIPRHGPELADELRRVGADIKRQAEEELSDLYPTDPDGATPIAYLWARTVRCETPECGAEIPLMRSFWLCKKKTRRRALKPLVTHDKGVAPAVAFEVFEPKTDAEVRGGTVVRAKATCLCCGGVLPPDRVRAQLTAQRGGADVIFDHDGHRIGGARMTAVVTLRPGERGRHYRLPTDADYAAVRRAQGRVRRMLDEWAAGGKQALCPVPDEPLPPIGTLGFRVQRYGMLKWGDLFTARQKAALSTLVSQTSSTTLADTDASLLAIGKLVDLGNTLCDWMPGQECPSAVFKLGRVKPGWDFVEGCVTSESSGSLHKCTANLAAGIVSAHVNGASNGQVMQARAQDSPLPDSSSAVYFTDPPYYNAIPYSDLSDVFLVWMKRTPSNQPGAWDPFDRDNPLSPKIDEVVQDETKQAGGRSKDRVWFEETMAKAFAEHRRILREDGVGSVVFAHKTTEGWEALLSGMIRGGWTITGSWPIATEMPHRIRARDSAALATSVHLICRPRPDDASVGDWADVLEDLPIRVADWIERLQGEGIRGADLVFACIGPALEIFSRYRRVETAEGRTVDLPEYLEKVWEVVGRAALGQVLGGRQEFGSNGLAGALEEDARLTALFLWTLQSTDLPPSNGKKETEDTEAVATAAARGFTLPYDVVRRFAQPMGIDLDRWNDRIVGQKKGVVRLLPVSERARELFGEDGARMAAQRIEGDATVDPQGALFPDVDTTPTPIGPRGGRQRERDGELRTHETTTLDRVHAAMLLQASGHANALRRLIDAEMDRGPDFLRLANALSALYPRGSREKRLLDAMLLGVPR